ncbi:MAG: HAD-IIIA family hydrolase [Pseudomonadota bacterium]
MKRFELLIFDWDGTLVDSESMIVATMQAAIGELNLPPRTDAQIGELIGLGLHDVLERLYPGLDQAHLHKLYDGYRIRFMSQGINDAPLFPGAEATLKKLHDEGYQLAIATGKSRRGLDRSLKLHTGIGALISHSRCADETASKPDPLMLRELLEETGFEPAQALMVGDTEYDMAMAKSIGMTALGVTCGVHDPERLLKTGAVAVIETVRELPGWLQGN